MKITISQEIAGYIPEFWGYSVERKENMNQDGGYASRELAVEAATAAATMILSAEGWDEEEIEEKITEALAE
jgi:hypothetical protein